MASNYHTVHQNSGDESLSSVDRSNTCESTYKSSKQSENVKRKDRRVRFVIGDEEDSDGEEKPTSEPHSLLDVLGTNDEEPWEKKSSSTDVLCWRSREPKNLDEWRIVNGEDYDDSIELENERESDTPGEHLRKCLEEALDEVDTDSTDTGTEMGYKGIPIPIIQSREVPPVQHIKPFGFYPGVPLHFTPYRGQQLYAGMATASNNANATQIFSERYAQEEERVGGEMNEETTHVLALPLASAGMERVWW